MNLTDLEREVRATLDEAGQQARVVEDLGTRAARPVRRRRTWLASGLAVAAIAAVGAVIAVTAPDEGGAGVAASPSARPSARPSITIPTSSWKPGDVQYQALNSGVLRITPEGCPYLASPDPRAPATAREGLIWPAGYSARYAGDGKAEVVAPNGSVVVREGGHLAVGGGLLPVSGKPCTFGAKNAFVIMEDLTR
jgi:hypothetical protein